MLWQYRGPAFWHSDMLSDPHFPSSVKGSLGIESLWDAANVRLALLNARSPPYLV